MPAWYTCFRCIADELSDNESNFHTIVLQVQTVGVTGMNRMELSRLPITPINIVRETRVRIS